MFKFAILFVLFATLLLSQTHAEFKDNFGTATMFVINGVPQRAPDGCKIERSWELTTSVVPDQERSREAYHVVAKALPRNNVNLNQLMLIGELSQMKQTVVDDFKDIYITPRIRLLYDVMRWEKKEVPYWIHTSGDMAAVLTGLALYAEYNTKNRDMNGYYIHENPFVYGETSAEAKKFESTQDFTNAHKAVNENMKKHFNVPQTNFPIAATVASFDLCRHIVATYNGNHEKIFWCKFFTEDALKVYEFREELNMQHGVWHNRFKFNQNVCGILDSLKSTINGELIGTTFITVTQQFMPFLDALGLLNKNLRAEDFAKQKDSKEWRLKNWAGLLSTMTVFKYDSKCSKKTEIFVNTKRQSMPLENLIGTLNRKYECK